MAFHEFAAMMNPLNLRLQAYTELTKDDHAALDRLAEGPLREVFARRDLIREGEAPRAAYLILSGWGCRYKALPDGRRQIVDFLVPGDMCDLDLHMVREMDHAIGAITTLKVVEIGPSELEQVCLASRRVAQALRMDELVKVSVQREWVLNVGQRTAYERLSHLLCEMFLRLEIVGLTDGTSCEFPLTQLDLADATGLTAVHVNRTLQELRKDGLIELHSRTLTIPDFSALRDAGLFNGTYLHRDRAGGRTNVYA
jgi:CRP-like cAMP-binding protein